MIRSLVFTTQGRLHSRNIEMFLMPTLLSDTNLFLWIDLETPTPEETKFVLEDLFHFHPLSIEDCVTVSPSPKVEEYTPKEEDKFAPYLFMVIHAVDYSRKDGVFATSELNFFLGKNSLVTYHALLGVRQGQEYFSRQLSFRDFPQLQFHGVAGRITLSFGLQPRVWLPKLHHLRHPFHFR